MGKSVFVVVAFDLTEYRLVRVFDKLESAEQFKTKLKELLWRKITISKCLIESDEKED